MTRSEKTMLREAKLLAKLANASKTHGEGRAYYWSSVALKWAAGELNERPSAMLGRRFQ